MVSSRVAAAVLAGVAIISISGNRPAEANSALLLPAICSSGVGCILVGAVVIAGVTYYVWQNQSTGERYRIPAGSVAAPLPIVDDENPTGWRPGDQAAVMRRNLCGRMARRYGKRLVRIEAIWKRDANGRRIGDRPSYYVCHFEREGN